MMHDDWPPWPDSKLIVATVGKRASWMTIWRGTTRDDRGDFRSLANAARATVGLMRTNTWTWIIALGVTLASVGCKSGGHPNSAPPLSVSENVSNPVASAFTTKTTSPTNCPAGMADIPAGTYRVAGPTHMGKPGDTVAVSEFCLDKTEVTVDAYKGCVDSGNCDQPGAYVNNPKQISCNWMHTPSRGNHPINCVGWNQATKYCSWLGKRLPTEAEWEWAARNGDRGDLYPWGNIAPNETLLNACGAERLRNHSREDSSTMYGGNDNWEETAPVGSFPKGDNRWGVSDLAGNVAEWTHLKHSGFPRDFCGSRGGSWYSSDSAEVTASNSDLTPCFLVASIGFRCTKAPFTNNPVPAPMTTPSASVLEHRPEP
jgi:formylglycine-generating enzyme required for sulfatase activity